MATMKTIKLKRNPQAAEISGELPEATQEVTASVDPAVGGEAHTSATQTPEPNPAATLPDADPVPNAGPKVSGKSYTPYVIMASVVIVLFLVILGLQYSEKAYFEAVPSVWAGK